MLKPPVKPMLLTTRIDPFNSKEYLFEFKWDGFRSLLFLQNDKIYLQSRKAKNLTPYFPELTNINKLLNLESGVLDGEICYFNVKGANKFSPLLKRLKNTSKLIQNKYPVTFIVWDILSLNDKNIMRLPLIERKKHLKNVIKKETNLLQISPFTIGKGKQMFKVAEEKNFEGIIAKKLDSQYESKRSDNWIKIKIWQYSYFKIGGFSKEKSSVLIGKKINNSKKLKYMGKVKISLSQNEKTALFKFLLSIKHDKSPFFNFKKKENTIWTKPLLNVKIRFSEITENDQLRHGSVIELPIEN